MTSCIAHRTATYAAIFGALGSLAQTAAGAQVNAGELRELRAEAGRNGAAAVMVHLEGVPLAMLKNQRQAVRVTMQDKARRLFEELGPEAWPVGRWENGAGQVGLYATSRGLDILAGSSNARSFFVGQPWKARTSLDDSDGSLSAIEAALQRSGAVDIEATLNVDGLEPALEADGRVQFRLPLDGRAAAATQGRTLLASLDNASLKNRRASYRPLNPWSRAARQARACRCV